MSVVDVVSRDGSGSALLLPGDILLVDERGLQPLHRYNVRRTRTGRRAVGWRVARSVPRSRME